MLATVRFFEIRKSDVHIESVVLRRQKLVKTSQGMPLLIVTTWYIASKHITECRTFSLQKCRLCLMFLQHVQFEDLLEVNTL